MVTQTDVEELVVFCAFIANLVWVLTHPQNYESLPVLFDMDGTHQKDPKSSSARVRKKRRNVAWACPALHI